MCRSTACSCFTSSTVAWSIQLPPSPLQLLQVSTRMWGLPAFSGGTCSMEARPFLAVASSLENSKRHMGHNVLPACHSESRVLCFRMWRFAGAPVTPNVSLMFLVTHSFKASYCHSFTHGSLDASHIANGNPRHPRSRLRTAPHHSSLTARRRSAPATRGEPRRWRRPPTNRTRQPQPRQEPRAHRRVIAGGRCRGSSACAS